MAEFKIGADSSPYQIVATTDPDYTNDIVVILEDLKGWDSLPEASRNTSEKILSDGEFISKYSKMKGRMVEVQIVFINEDPAEVRNLRRKIAAWKTTSDFFPVTFTRVFGEEEHEETLEDCFIQGEVLWEEIVGSHVRVNIVFKSRNAYKVLRIDEDEPILSI